MDTSSDPCLPTAGTSHEWDPQWSTTLFQSAFEVFGILTESASANQTLSFEDTARTRWVVTVLHQSEPDFPSRHIRSGIRRVP